MVYIKWVVEEKDGKYYSLASMKMSPRAMRKSLSPLAFRIMEELARGPCYPKKLAVKLGVHEQKVYYHIRNMKISGMIKIVREENINGVVAKYYGLEKPSFFISLKEGELSAGMPKLGSGEMLEQFLAGGSLDALIILGSPEPHGPMKARAKDGVYSINLGIFLGSFVNSLHPNQVKLDTEVKGDDLKKNLIVIGGPAVNQVCAMVNDKLPVRFRESPKNQYFSVYSSLSRKTYEEEECGIVVKFKNPFDPTKQIILLAGRRAAGTKTAILAFTSHQDRIMRGNKYSRKVFAKVFEGLDNDSDGIIDSVEERE